MGLRRLAMAIKLFCYFRYNGDIGRKACRVCAEDKKHTARCPISLMSRLGVTNDLAFAIWREYGGKGYTFYLDSAGSGSNYCPCCCRYAYRGTPRHKKNCPMEASIRFLASIGYFDEQRRKYDESMKRARLKYAGDSSLPF